MGESVASFGHNTQGLNMKNFKALDKPNRMAGFRAPKDWDQEVTDVVHDCSKEAFVTSKMRASGQAAMDAASRALKNKLSGTEAALIQKINQTQTLKGELEKALLDTDLELQMQRSTRAKIDRLAKRKASKLALNEQRLAVRSQRPHRELTSDDVQLQLVTQGQLLTNYVHKLGKGVAATETDICCLQDCRAALQADLRDKEAAIQIDRAALAAEASDYGTLDGSLQRKALVYPHTWHTSTKNSVDTARHWQQDAVNLRKFLAKTVAENRKADRKLSDTLEKSMQERINWTRKNRESLERQADAIKDEISKARQRKLDLVEAARAKVGPAALAKHRYMLRKNRPQREQVQDAVEESLLAELNTIRAHAATLQTNIAAIDHQIELLQGAWQHVQTHLADKRRGEQVDVQAAMLDGRGNIGRPVSAASSTMSSLYSFKHEPQARASSARPATAAVSRMPLASSRSSSARRSDTHSRIAALEAELSTARLERTHMEQDIRKLSNTAA